MGSGEAVDGTSGRRRRWDRRRRARQSETCTNRASARPPIEPALTPTITRRLGRVVPANLQIDARWDAIRDARAAAKKADGKSAASPSVMVAWAVVRAMEKHAPFRRIMLEDDSIEEHNEFDLGIAVALENDRLATAVVTKANTRDWPDFVQRYNETVEETRGRPSRCRQRARSSSAASAPSVCARPRPSSSRPRSGRSLSAPPIKRLLGNGKKNESAEVITLSLTFDHRVVNGAGAASFVHDIKEEMERFRIPATTSKGQPIKHS